MTMIRRFSLLFAAALAAALLAAPGAGAFGVVDPEVAFQGDGAGEAGTHPFAITTTFEAQTKPAGPGQLLPDEDFKDLVVDLPEGLAGTPTPVPPCSNADFLVIDSEHAFSACPESSAVGVVEVAAGFGTLPEGEDPFEAAGLGTLPVYNLTPPPGVAAKLGFVVLGLPVTIEAGLNPDPPHNLQAHVTNVPQAAQFYGSRLTLWGVPADPVHDAQRGPCAAGPGTCSVSLPEKPFFTMPRSCAAPLETIFEARSWQSPGTWVDASAQSPAMSDCEKLAFEADITAQPTTDRAASPSGLDFELAVDDEGLTTPDGRANSDIRRTVVTLPEGMTINPSQAEGLGTCPEADLDDETASSAPGEGCPQDSKIGTIEVETPLLEDEVLRGTLYVAEPYENPFGTLLAVYVVIKDPGLGISITQPLRVEPDPDTGQLITTAPDMPQLPFSEFRLRFREGARSPLITPPGCGDFEVEAEFTPWAGGPDFTTSSSFEIDSGPGGGACQRGTASFEPGFTAGTLNNAAGAYSPFLMRITRADGEQDLAKFSAVLPPGVLGRIAGVPWCPEAGIARARARSGQDGGQDEIDDPSCPAASILGHTTAGAGAGSELTYVPGALYLAGPYKGAPLSVVSITPAVAGPFDAGTVVVRVGLDLDPRTARVQVDGAASDEIPHLLKGIPLNVRDLRVHADRPAFTLNATSCDPSATLATLWGAGTALDPRFPTPVGAGARYQAAGCAALGFEPKLGIKLRGGVKRGAHPALRAVVTPKPGQANFERAVVTLPRSAFLEQAHIRTICTRVQFAAGPGNGAACPPAARYGFARVWSPLLDAPAQGPVYLRSSDNQLPDLVVALTGPPSAPFRVELSARIDSVRGGIRSTFTGIPDVPVSRFILDMQGGKKGLIVNSRHLCHKPKRNRAKANLRGQNGKLSRTRPVVRAVKCKRRRDARRSARISVARASEVG